MARFRWNYTPALEEEEGSIFDNGVYKPQVYTKEDFLRLCNGNEKLARFIREQCEWTYPETIIDEFCESDDLEADFDLLTSLCFKQKAN